MHKTDITIIIILTLEPWYTTYKAVTKSWIATWHSRKRASNKTSNVKVKNNVGLLGVA